MRRYRFPYGNGYITSVHIDPRLVGRSRASERFKAALRALVAQQDDECIVLARRIPRVKVVRLLTHLLNAHPEFGVERVFIDARSGCSDLHGTLIVEGAGDARVFEFVWDCRWRAEQEGWFDAFGFPDQIRAASEFDWRCFAQWEERDARSAQVSGHPAPCC